MLCTVLGGFRVVHIVAAQAKKVSRRERERKERPTTGHGSCVASIKGQTKRYEGPLIPQRKPSTGSSGNRFQTRPQDEYRKWKEKKIQKDSKKQRRGYEWLF